jgi:hypothetical protein
VRNHLLGSVAILIAANGLSVIAKAQFAPAVASPTGTGMAHDLSGVWNAGVGGGQAAAPVGGAGAAAPAQRAAANTAAGPKMLPAAQAKFDANTFELKNDRPITIDPAYTCHPPGLPHAFANGAFPFEIVQTPQRIFIFYESAHLWREIWMDARPMPKETDPLWMGYGIGHWDGDDLVVNLDHFNDQTWLDAAGHPHTEALKITERYHRADHDTLQISFTIDDPQSYSEPWTTRSTFKLKPKWEIGEAFCVPDDQEKFERHILAPNGKPSPAR